MSERRPAADGEGLRRCPGRGAASIADAVAADVAANVVADVAAGFAPIAIDALGKRYGDFLAVDALSLRVHRGEVFGFLGPNGAGKTTTIRMMMGILVPSAGRVPVDGLDCHGDAAEVKRRVGYLPDTPVFYDYLRGREILNSSARCTA